MLYNKEYKRDIRGIVTFNAVFSYLHCPNYKKAWFLNRNASNNRKLCIMNYSLLINLAIFAPAFCKECKTYLLISSDELQH